MRCTGTSRPGRVHSDRSLHGNSGSYSISLHVPTDRNKAALCTNVREMVWLVLTCHAPQCTNPLLFQRPLPTPSAPGTPAVLIPTVQECSVCGDGFEVGAPLVTILFENQPPVQCGDLELTSELGLFPASICAQLPEAIFAACECQVIAAMPSSA